MSNHSKTFLLASLRGLRLAYPRSAREDAVTATRRPENIADGVEMREKWAGADSNCGYGHPKAEGYQATPPARIPNVVVSSFNASERASAVGFRRRLTRSTDPGGDDTPG